MVRSWATVFVAVLALAGVVAAHSISVWAEVRENRVWVEAYDTEGNGLREAQIRVEDAGGKLLLEGKTDEKGKWDFAPPNKEEMVIQLILDDHHKSKQTLKAEDLKDVVLAQPTP